MICEVVKVRKIGWFKDELSGCVMSEMLGLNPTSYAFKHQPIKQKKDFIKTLEDTLITCNTYKNTETSNKSSKGIGVRKSKKQFKRKHIKISKKRKSSKIKNTIKKRKSSRRKK